VKAYLDSGVFIDYLVAEGHPGIRLRSTKRRARDPERLRSDAEKCLAAIRHGHTGTTSAVTCWEIEEAMYAELVRSSAADEMPKRRSVAIARDLVTHMLITLISFGFS
jgi:hypothetical protein